MANFEAGAIVNFFEGGGIHQVEIISNECNDTREAFKLRIIKTLLPDPLFGEKKPGEEFFCEQKKGYCLWKLE